MGFLFYFKTVYQFCNRCSIDSFNHSYTAKTANRFFTGNG